MYHFFNTFIAKKYGVHQALLLNHLNFWIEKNKANNKHFHDNHYWTYSTTKALAQLLDYLNERQITYAINKLIECGLIIKGNYNTSPFDRTCWYAITEKGYSELNRNCEADLTKLSNGTNTAIEPETTTSSSSNKQDAHLTKSSNGKTNIVKAIPDIKTDNNIYIYKSKKITQESEKVNTQNENKKRPTAADIQQVVDLFKNLCPSLRQPTVLTTGRSIAIARLLEQYTLEEIKTTFTKAENSSFLTGNNKDGFCAHFDFVVSTTNFLKIAEGTYDKVQNNTTSFLAKSKAQKPKKVKKGDSMNASYDIDEYEKYYSLDEEYSGDEETPKNSPQNHNSSESSDCLPPFEHDSEFENRSIFGNLPSLSEYLLDKIEYDDFNLHG